jgi:hypothetical protein
VWVNPPYGREYNDPWARKMARDAERDDVSTITALVSAATSTDRWHEHLNDADLFTFLDHRVGFVGEMDGHASFASVIVTFNAQNVNSEYVAVLEALGLVLERKNALREVGAWF